MNKFLDLYNTNSQLNLNDKEELVSYFEDDLIFDDILNSETIQPSNFEYILKTYGWFWITFDSDPTIRKQPHAVIVTDITSNTNFDSTFIKYYDVYNGNIIEVLFSDFILRVKQGSLDLSKSLIRLPRRPFEGKSARQSKPKWLDVFNGYPKTLDSSTNSYYDLPASDVFTSVLGSGYDSTKFDDACATRVSIALLAGGINVRKSFLVQVGKYKGKGFIARANGLKEWLIKIWGTANVYVKGPTTLSDVKSKIGSKNGVYIIVGAIGSSTGHATLWLGAQGDAIGNKNYIDRGGDVYFWELK